jgi:hypothetical protein
LLELSRDVYPLGAEFQFDVALLYAMRKCRICELPLEFDSVIDGAVIFVEEVVLNDKALPPIGEVPWPRSTTAITAVAFVQVPEVWSVAVATVYANRWPLVPPEVMFVHVGTVPPADGMDGAAPAESLWE